MTFKLNSPFLDLEFERKPKHWIAVSVGWTVIWITVTVALVYLYAAVLPAYIGLETTVLVGIAILILKA